MLVPKRAKSLCGYWAASAGTGRVMYPHWASLFLFAKFVELSHACCRLGDRSRPSPPSRDDAGDVAQSGRWLERVMVGIDNDGADATNNNGDNKQILSSSHNDDDIDDGDRSTYVQENMINEI